MVPVEAVDLIEGRGAAGDRYSRRDGGRQVTLIQAEDIAAIASYLGHDVSPSDLRRNIVTVGVNLLALKGRRFRLGDAILEHSGECQPCSRMEETFGPGGYNAVRGRGGITARVVSSGRVCVGDALRDL
jgi:MOSC domain-containing protein YiiM